jgi:hypothetical protein
MPTARSPADVLCLALYVLAEGKVLRGFMLTTIAGRLGIDFARAEAMAIAADAAGLVSHRAGTVTLTGDGQRRGATLTAPTVKTPAAHRPSGKAQPPQATPRPRRRG